MICNRFFRKLLKQFLSEDILWRLNISVMQYN